MIRCEVRVHDPGLASWQIYVHRAPSPRTAVRWLRGRAGALADRIDPDPDPWVTTWIPPRYLQLVTAPPLDDVPQFLRMWASDEAAHEDARTALAAGHPVAVATHDATAYYTLTAVPTGATAKWPGAAPPPGGQRP